MAERLFGIETEYGLAAGAGQAGALTRDEAAFSLVTRALGEVPCLPDLGDGVFLQNGARFYVDCGHHPEMTTPEVSSPWDIVRYILAGERLLEELAAPRPGQSKAAAPLLLKSNVCYASKATWGCHESILHTADSVTLPDQLVPHLVSRVIYTGAGGFNPFSPGVEFVLSPRALMLESARSSESTRRRGIFHTKNETLSRNGHERLHIICGDSLCSEVAMWLRSATTVLAVAMADGGLRPGDDVALEAPVCALHTIVADPTCRATVAASGRRLTALDIQRHYLRLAEAHVHADFMPPWTEMACRQWRMMLDRLEAAPGSVATTLDWAVKRAVFERVLARHGFDWARVNAWTDTVVMLWNCLGRNLPQGYPWKLEQLVKPSGELAGPEREADALLRARGLSWDDLPAFIRLRQALFESDVRFSQLGGDGIFAQLDRAGVLTHHAPGVDNIQQAMTMPPATGRARLRGDVIRRVQRDRDRFAATWQSVINYAEQIELDLSDPFEREERWNPMTGDPVRRPPAPPPAIGTNGESPRGTLDPYERRSEALASYLRGDCENAERMLRSLLLDHFDIPGTRCHLARVYLTMGRQNDARTQAIMAWVERRPEPRYVLGRTLWFLTLFALLDGEDASEWIGRIKTLGPDASATNGWTMEPLLARLRPRMAAEHYAIVLALFHALAGHRGGGSLHRLEWWNNAAPVPVD